MKKATALLLLFSMAFAAMSFLPANTGGGYKVGDTAQDFSLVNVKGKQVSLAGIKNAKGYIVVFTCNHCPYAKAYERRIIDLHKKYAPMGFPVVAINSNDKDVQPQDSYDNMKKLAKKKKYPFNYVYDETQEIARAYGATRTPHVYVLDKDRVVRYIGAIDDNSEDPAMAKEHYVANAVDALLSGKEIATKETKAIGCGIKWKK
ncbi:MAG TPA: thioredoxin family protein [Saprospiraceae bacterium]|nr:thioredoxin family protein [Saprospiraceae bacterium]